MIKLFPKVSKMKLNEGRFTVPETLSCFFKNEKVNVFKGFSNKTILISEKIENADIIYEKKNLPSQSYELIVADKVYINYGDDAGAFYGSVTLNQLLTMDSIECLEIFDKPDLEIRGFMYDISRNKVATLETLKSIVDKMMLVKMNHFEVYVEGFSYEYKSFAEYLEKDGFITVEEYLELQDYCFERFIDFVPNQNGFGHMAKWLEKDEFSSLKICPEGMHLWGRFRPASTLNPLNEGSIELVKKMYKDMLPHCKSKYFNMNFDEPFELGKGLTLEKANEVGVGNLYIDYALKAYDEIKKYQKTPIIWGDVLVKHPDLLYRLPKDMIFMDWGYDVNYPFAEHAKMLKEQGVKFLCAPGTTGWCTWTGRLFDWLGSITNSVLAAKDNGGLGIVLTEWGDFGHLQSVIINYAPLAFAGLYSWNANEGTILTLRDFLNQYVFEDKNNIAADWFIDFSNYYRYENEYSINNTLTFKVFMWGSWSVGDNKQKTDDEKIAYYKARVHENYIPTAKFRVMQKYFDFKLEELEFTDIQTKDSNLIKEECKHAIDTLRLVQKLAVSFNKDIDVKERISYLNDIIAGHDDYLAKEKELWLARSKSGGLKDSIELIENFYKFAEIVLSKLTKGEAL